MQKTQLDGFHVQEHPPDDGGDDEEQEGSDDHVAEASQYKGDGVARVPDMGTQTRPKKPPDAGGVKLQKIGPGLLRLLR